MNLDIWEHPYLSALPVPWSACPTRSPWHRSCSRQPHRWSRGTFYWRNPGETGDLAQCHHGKTTQDQTLKHEQYHKTRRPKSPSLIVFTKQNSVIPKRISIVTYAYWNDATCLIRTAYAPKILFLYLPFCMQHFITIIRLQNLVTVYISYLIWWIIN